MVVHALSIAVIVLAGAIQPAAAPMTTPTVAGETHTVTVEKVGSGSGRVVADEISCGQDCVGSYPADGAPVRLMAYSARDSTFMGWTGCDYASGNECVVAASSDRVVGARFEPGVATEITSSMVRARMRRATFEFTGSSPRGAVTFECRLDGREFRSCSSPRSYRQLRAGSHTFRVRAVDSSDVADPTPARMAFVIRR